MNVQLDTLTAVDVGICAGPGAGDPDAAPSAVDRRDRHAYGYLSPILVEFMATAVGDPRRQQLRDELAMGFWPLVVVLRFFNELTQTQIAERVGLSQMHVSRLLGRTLATLRGRIDVVDEKSSPRAGNRGGAVADPRARR